MPSTVDTEQDCANSNANLVACLALYQHRQDQASGIHWVSERTRGLLWYYGRLQHTEITRLLMAGYLNGAIQQGAKEIAILVKEAETATDKQSILTQVKSIQAHIKAAKEELDKINQEITRNGELNG